MCKEIVNMNPIYTKEAVAQLASFINKSQSIVITVHKSPDGDAIGSAIALQELLKQLGKKSVVVVPDEFPNFLNWLQGTEEIIVADKQKEVTEKLISECDLLFSLDYNAPHRAGNLEEMIIQAKANKVMIDHHQQPDDYCDITFSDVSSCSTAQLIYELAEALELEKGLSNTAQQAIYLGILTDTGSFRFSSVKPKTHRVLANLLEAGLDHDFINRKVFDDNSLNRLQLRGFAIAERLEVLPELKTGIINLTQADLKKYNASKGGTGGLVNMGLSISRVEGAFFLREQENEVRISMRSTGVFSVNELSRENFSGGGHTNAAGGISREDMAATIARVKTVMASKTEQIKEIYG